MIHLFNLSCSQQTTHRVSRKKTVGWGTTVNHVEWYECEVDELGHFFVNLYLGPGSNSKEV